tara:strand:+ start:726 stop:875 length:150 start_codon:yes stop_codon:yes gene_type:complete
MTKQTIAEEFALKKIELRSRHGNTISRSKVKMVRELKNKKNAKRKTKND